MRRDDYHGRFWVCKEKENGIVLGISLNYEKVKKAYINELNDNDIKIIIDDLKGQKNAILKKSIFIEAYYQRKIKYI